MNTITTTQIATDTTLEDALAAIEELQQFGHVVSTNDEPLQVTDDYGNALAAQEAVDAIRSLIAEGSDRA